MPAVIPMVAAFAAAGGTIAGVGAALTGAAGFATFATVAGGFMASAGMLTKNKTLTKIGSVLGLAGAVTSLASSLSGASSAAAGASGEAAKEAVTEAAKESASEALKSEMANTAVGEAIGKAGTEAAQVGQTLGTATSNASAAAAPMTLAEPGANLLDLARGTSDYGLVSRGLEGASVVTDAAQNQALSKLAEAGSQIQNKTALDTILEKASGIGKWVKDNPAIAQIGGQALAGGMQAYQQGQQFDEQLNLLEARRRRLNQPVALGIQPIKIGG